MSLKLYIGCMYSGKTTELMRECRRQLSINKNVICINYKNDTRYGEDEYMYNHNMDKINCIKVEKLDEVDDYDVDKCDLIMINEGQFFTDLVDNVVKWVETYDKDVIVSGLDGDFQRKKFGTLLDLIPLCDEVHKFSALCVSCKDGTEANFTHRLTEEKEQVVIGASNYVPLCRKCYLESNS